MAGGFGVEWRGRKRVRAPVLEERPDWTRGHGSKKKAKLIDAGLSECGIAYCTSLRAREAQEAK